MDLSLRFYPGAIFVSSSARNADNRSWFLIVSRDPRHRDCYGNVEHRMLVLMVSSEHVTMRTFYHFSPHEQPYYWEEVIP